MAPNQPIEWTRYRAPLIGALDLPETFMPLTDHQAIAIEEFVLSTTIPIFFDACEAAVLLGTGTLFEIREHSFLITARHIFDDVPDYTKLSYPESPLRGGLHTLGSSTVLKPKEEHIDIAVIELQCQNTIERLRSNWKFLTLENVVSQCSPVSDDEFLISGYPLSLSTSQPDLSKCKLVTVYTNSLRSVPAEAIQPVMAGLDLFFEYGKDAISIQGEIINTPNLRGMSGSSVWRLGPVAGIWTPEKAALVVGIQSSYNHSRYIRAKSWMAVESLLDSAGDGFGERIRDHLGEI